MRRRKVDVAADIPARRVADLPVELDDEVGRSIRDAERELARRMVAALRDGRSPPVRRAGPSRASTTQLVRQVATWEREDTASSSGENVFTMMRRIGQAKAGLAADYAAQLARSVGKVVFFAKHIDVMDTAEETFARRGIRYTSIRGDQSKKAREKNIDDFVNDPEVEVIVCSLTAAGVGINLQVASNLVLAELSWTDAEQTQAIDRVHRIGQSEPVTAWRIIAAQTIDARIAELIDSKAGLAARALDGADETVAILGRRPARGPGHPAHRGARGEAGLNRIAPSVRVRGGGGDGGEPGRPDAAAARRARRRALGLLPAADRPRPGAGGGRRAGDPAAGLAQLPRARRVAGLGPGLAVHRRPQHRDRRVAHQARRRARSRSPTCPTSPARPTAPTSCCCRGWSPRRSPGSRRSTARCCVECYYRGLPVAEAAERLGHPRRHREVAHPLRAARAAARAGGDGGGGMSGCEFAHDDAALRARRAAARRAARPSSATSPPAPSARARCGELAGLPGLLGRLTLEDVESAADPSRCPTRCCPPGRGGTPRRSDAVAGRSVWPRPPPSCAIAAARRDRRRTVDVRGRAAPHRGRAGDDPGRPGPRGRQRRADLGRVGHPAGPDVQLRRAERRLPAPTRRSRPTRSWSAPTDGAVEQVATWKALPGKTMHLTGATALDTDHIASVEVRTADGRPVLELTG